jgi:hypothetical protein
MTAPKKAAISGSRTSPLHGAIKVRYAMPIPKTIRAPTMISKTTRAVRFRAIVPHHSCCRAFQFDGELQSLQVDPLRSYLPAVIVANRTGTLT